MKTGKHIVTALTRADSKSKLPEGVKAAQIDYNDETTLVSALKGQQVLLITLAVSAPANTELKLVRAAEKAGVAYVMPNCWGVDFHDQELANDGMISKIPLLNEIEAAGKVSWIALVCGFWYEYSLISAPQLFGFGFDIKGKKLTMYDDGKTKINISTWDQCGRAIAALFSLKELPEDENDKSVTVSNWRNKSVYISSFLISQTDMFESWKRITGDKGEDWSIDYEPSDERYKKGKERLQQTGDKTGFGQLLYARVFYPNGGGDYESIRGLDNSLLGLPEEDLDERTKIAKGMLEDGYSYFTRH